MRININPDVIRRTSVGSGKRANPAFAKPWPETPAPATWDADSAARWRALGRQTAGQCISAGEAADLSGAFLGECGLILCRLFGPPAHYVDVTAAGAVGAVARR